MASTSPFSQMTNPTILFVHGSWHTPAHFAPVREVFEKAGYPTACPRQPSVGNKPPLGAQNDVRRIQAELSELIEREEKDVVVVAHSYGGVIATQAVLQEYGRKERQKEGEQGGVVRIVYMCAFLLDVGMSLVTALGGELPPFIPVDDEQMCEMLDPAMRFYNDLTSAEQQHWVNELLKSPVSTQFFAIDHAAYMYHPVTYLFCEQDQALPFEMQKMMVGKVKELGVDVGEEVCGAGHSPFLSMPEMVLEVVKRAAV